jgi:hypothetical protein
LRQRQSGQALVAVLVVTTLIFLLAGAVSIGAVSVLTRMDRTHDNLADDFAAQSAVAWAASRAAQPSTCPLIARQFALTLPTSPTRPTGWCVGVSGVAPPPYSSLSPKPPLPWSVTTLPAPKTSQQTSLLILLFGRWQSDACIYVGSTASPTGLCPPQCSASPPTQSLAPVALLCPLSSLSPPLSLFIRNGGVPPTQVFYATSDGTASGNGTAFLFVVGTGRGPGKDYEAAVFFKPSTGPLQLQYEAPLP